MSRSSDGRQHNTNRIRQTFRSDSPKYDKYSRHRKPDPNTEELIRFVREHQRDRQPTTIRLQKLAPLPSIGQSHAPIEVPRITNIVSTSLNSFEESDADDGLGDSYPDVDDDFDSEVASCTDSFAPIEDICTYRGMSNAQIHSGTVIKKKLKKSGKSRMRICSDQTYTSHSSNHLVRTKLDPKNRKLPPLVRDDMPSRPGAPVPSYAMESCHSPNALTVEEEDPIDYIE
ncbi:uncharacterized protein LOC135469325 [Liolophura sinensis]|uniref:uncharacterized protein LOC135469325 n=1 Tax=Liolophura sinensis TaxID=3198878 RepID=UPI0031585118